MRDITVGLDIGTTSVKAVAADGDGTIVRRARVVHPVLAPTPDVFEHDAGRVWRDGVRTAWGEVSDGLEVAAVTVSAMVPSLCGVDGSGEPVTEGLLYGDSRGRATSAATGDTTIEGEVVGFAAALAGEPGVEQLWPAQAVANHALCGVGAIDSTSAMTMTPLFAGAGWDTDLCERVGITPEQLPTVSPGVAPIGRMGDTLVTGGTIDAVAEQLVSDSGDPGDVLVICGTTLIVWGVTGEEHWRDVEGLWTVPYTRPGTIAIGGASNAGGLFLDRVRRLVGEVDPVELAALDPGGLPVWLPYIRGERTPLHDHTRRAELLDLATGHDRAHVLRAAYEAAGFVARHHLELADTSPTRIVATGGGTRSIDWMQALADTTGLPVDVAAVPEGAALGAAFLSRMAAGLEPDQSRARGWSPTGHRVEPRPEWVEATERRYRRFLEETRR